MTTTLLLLDAQVNMFDPSMPVFNSVALLESLATLIRNARRAGIPVVYMQHAGGPGDIDEPGAPGFEIHPQLAHLSGDLVLVKRTPNAFHETSLQAALEKIGVTGLVVAGLQSDLCIDATCRAALALGYAVTLVADAHSTYDSSKETAPEISARINRELTSLVDVIPMKALSLPER